MPSERSLYRSVERAGRGFALVMDQHQIIINKFDLASKEQFLDFSSTYFEGKAVDVGDFGYSRDSLPGKKQITFGISTGINSIPTALTIQRGNLPDKKHFRLLLRMAEAILDSESVVIFDCGANTKANKKLIRNKHLHYLTLRQKKVGPYRIAVGAFTNGKKTSFEINDVRYDCVKILNNDEFQYIYFSEKLRQEQLQIKAGKFRVEINKNEPLLKRTRKGKPLGQYPVSDGIIVAKGSLQTLVDGPVNPHINGIEGFFILESDIDAEPQKILALYKDKDKVEKLIRNIKEGTELHPIRHWSKWMVIGYVLLVFLTNFIINLTLYLAKKPLVKNVKLLKKFLMKLTVTVVYPETGFRFHVISNITDEIRSILGDYIDKYRDKSLSLRW
jgi:transposase